MVRSTLRPRAPMALKTFTPSVRISTRITEVQYDSTRRVRKTQTATKLTGGGPRAGSSKRPRSPSPDPDAEWEDVNVDAPETESREKKKAKRNVSTKLAEWKPRLPKIQESIFASSVDVGVSEACPCARGALALFRCEDCSQPAVCCKTCLFEQHQNNHLHWVAGWNGSFFLRTDLSRLGFVVHLGHNGRACPGRLDVNISCDISLRPYKMGTTTTTVVHSNGIHESCIQYCECPGREDDSVRVPDKSRFYQLLRAHLFPASLDSPRTAFSFHVLHQHHMLFRCGKIATQDFVNALKRLTSATGVLINSPDRYQDMTLLRRIWAHLYLRRRSGQEHGIGRLMPKWAGSLAPPCVACPQVGFNIDPNFKARPQADRYLERDTVGSDGNASLRSKIRIKKGDAADRGLNGGHAYCADVSDLDIHLEKMKDDAPPRTCVGFRAGDLQKSARYKGYVITGVVMSMCTRHAMVRPGSIVDMTVGERFALVDYSLMASFRHSLDLLEHMHTYDVVCQHSVNLVARLVESGVLTPEMEHVLRSLIHALPAWHGNCHCWHCRDNFSLRYTQGAGRSHGERVEHLWKETNQLGLSTREMNPGARHDAIDDAIDEWNIVQLENIVDYLGRKLEEVCTDAPMTAKTFQQLFEAAGEKVREWEMLPRTVELVDDGEVEDQGKKKRGKKKLTAREMEEAGKKKSTRLKGKWVSPYTSSMEVPSIDSLLHDMRNSEWRSGQTDQKSSDPPAASNTELPVGTADYVAEGVALSMEQEDLKYRMKKSDEDDVTSAFSTEQQRLRRSIKIWRTKHPEYLGRLYDCSPDDISNEQPATFRTEQKGPEDEDLFLPSSVADREHVDEAIAPLVECERKIREAYAYDQLQELKRAVIINKRTAKDARKILHSVSSRTRGQRAIASLRDQCLTIVRRYNRNRRYLMVLGLEDDSPLRVIDPKADLALKIGEVKQARSWADARKDVPWIWTVQDQHFRSNAVSAETQADFVAEVERVSWFIAREEAERHREEIQLLHEEFRRTIRGFRKLHDIWHELSLQLIDSRGKQAFAAQQSHLFGQMLENAEQQYTECQAEFGSGDGSGDNPTNPEDYEDFGSLDDVVLG